MPPLPRELTIQIQPASPERGVQERKEHSRAGRRATQSGSQRGEPGAPRGLLGVRGAAFPTLWLSSRGASPGDNPLATVIQNGRWTGVPLVTADLEVKPAAPGLPVQTPGVRGVFGQHVSRSLPRPRPLVRAHPTIWAMAERKKSRS